MGSNACRQRAITWPWVLACLFVLGGCAQTQGLNTERNVNAPPQAAGGTSIARKAPGITVERLPVASETAASDDYLPPLRPDPDPAYGAQPAAPAAPGGSVALERLSSNPFENQRRDSARSLPPVSAAPAERQARPRRPIVGAPATAASPSRSEFSRERDVRPAPQERSAPRSTSSGLVLGEGDVIAFKMFGQEDMEATAFVSADGMVSLPLIGETEIGGLTPGQAEARITQAYRDGGFFKNPQVNVTLEEFRSQQISVLGEVNLPGRYPLETRTTVLDALALAEGVMPTGARVVTVIRKTGNGTEQFRVDLDALVENASQNASVTLAAGDIVYVPEAELFYIYGEVRRPDAYAIKPGMTLMQALSLGGGLTDKGSNSRIEIQRKTQRGLDTLHPKLTDKIESDDVIYVKERFF